MNTLVLLDYFRWHYSSALISGFNIWRDFLWFVFHFFSIEALTRTLFAPWRRLGEKYPQNLEPGIWVAAFLVNTMMRVVGAFARTSLIIAGSLAWALAFLTGFLVAILWILLPVILVGLFFWGIYLIILG